MKELKLKDDDTNGGKMNAFPNWQQYAVPQRRQVTGCIPTGYEMMLRAADVTYVDYSSFQNEFDLDKDLKHGEMPKNNFVSVADSIQKKYPDIIFKREEFTEGRHKMNRIYELILKEQPVLISLAIVVQTTLVGYHIMPIVDIEGDELILLWHKDFNNQIDIMKITEQKVIDIHDNYPGGNDIAYLFKY